MGKGKKKQRSQGTHINKYSLDGTPKIGKKENKKSRRSYVPKGGERKEGQEPAYIGHFQPAGERRTQSLGYSYFQENNGYDRGGLSDSENFTIKMGEGPRNMKVYEVTRREGRNTSIESVEVSFSEMDGDPFYNVKYSTGLQKMYTQLPPEHMNPNRGINRGTVREMEEIKGLIEKVNN